MLRTFALRNKSESNLRLVMDAVEEKGYKCCAHKLKASDYGVPQRRLRYYIIGIRDNFADDPGNILRNVGENVARLKVTLENSPFGATVVGGLETETVTVTEK